MPILALGTWQYNDTVAADAIHKGIKAGFTHIDTAENYGNQKGVGAALKSYPRDSSEPRYPSRARMRGAPPPRAGPPWC